MNCNPEQFVTATEIKHYFESMYVVVCYAAVWQHIIGMVCVLWCGSIS